MTATATKPTATRNVLLTRIVNAPRALVFKMWTEPKHMAQWWGPHGFTNPVCEIDARVGGRIWIVMHGPAGTDFDQDYPMSGTFHEIVVPERLVFTAVTEDKDGTPLLEAHTTVTFEDAGGKTKVTVQAHGVGLVPVAVQMIAGMEQGWSGSLERLADLAARVRS